MALEIRRNFGYLGKINDARDWKYGDGLKGALASERLSVGQEIRPLVMARNTSKMPVFDQGEIGSCVGCAVGTLHSLIRGVSSRSKLQIYYEARRLIGFESMDTGCYIRDAINVISTLGAGRESWWPYDVSNFAVDPPLKVDRDALKRKIFSYWALEGREQYQHCLESGFPIVLGSNLYSNFVDDYSTRSGIIRMPIRGEHAIGGHAYLVIGRHREFHTSDWAKMMVQSGYPEGQIPHDVYICQNSWGTGWGYRGLFAVAAEFIDNPVFTDDAWTIRKIREPASVAA